MACKFEHIEFNWNKGKSHDLHLTIQSSNQKE